MKKGLAPKLKKPIPFAFVLDLLETVDPLTRPMFGCIAVYVGDKIIFILRDSEKYTQDNGVWIATSRDHHESLLKTLPSLRAISVFGEGPTNWRILPVDSPSFEEEVGSAVEMVLRGDARIGRIPKPKKKRIKK
jgi:hypothetical protein